MIDQEAEQFRDDCNERLATLIGEMIPQGSDHCQERLLGVSILLTKYAIQLLIISAMMGFEGERTDEEMERMEHDLMQRRGRICEKAYSSIQDAGSLPVSRKDTSPLRFAKVIFN